MEMQSVLLAKGCELQKTMLHVYPTGLTSVICGVDDEVRVGPSWDNTTVLKVMRYKACGHLEVAWEH